MQYFRKKWIAYVSIMNENITTCLFQQLSKNEEMSDSENEGTVELQIVTAIDTDVNTEDCEIATTES